MAMRPFAFRSPAIDSMSDVLPEPERPTSAGTCAVSVQRASSVKRASGRRRSISMDISMVTAMDQHRADARERCGDQHDVKNEQRGVGVAALLHAVVDRQRDGLRAAGDVAGDEDGRAELADGAAVRK